METLVTFFKDLKHSLRMFLAEPGLHRRRGGRIGPRYRLKHRDFLGCECGPFETAAVFSSR